MAMVDNVYWLHI